MKLILKWTAAVVALATAALVGYKTWQLKGQRPNWSRVVQTETGGKPHYEPIQYRAKDSRPAITNPEFVSAEETQMAAGTMGMGVAVGGESKFYPLHLLSYHQIVNDTCGGKPIACTY